MSGLGVYYCMLRFDGTDWEYWYALGFVASYYSDYSCVFNLGFTSSNFVILFVVVIDESSSSACRISGLTRGGCLGRLFRQSAGQALPAFQVPESGVCAQCSVVGWCSVVQRAASRRCRPWFLWKPYLGLETYFWKVCI